MMQTFRNNMKAIFFILIFFFVGWMAVTLTGFDDYLIQQNKAEVRGMKYAGVVNGENISRSIFRGELKQARRVLDGGAALNV